MYKVYMSYKSVSRKVPAAPCARWVGQRQEQSNGDDGLTFKWLKGFLVSVCTLESTGRLVLVGAGLGGPINAKLIADQLPGGETQKPVGYSLALLARTVRQACS